MDPLDSLPPLKLIGPQEGGVTTKSRVYVPMKAAVRVPPEPDTVTVVELAVALRMATCPAPPQLLNK